MPNNYVMRRRLEQQPSLEFEEPGPKPEEQTNKSPRPTPEEIMQGWCSECDMPAGSGTCTKCIRIKRQRGEEYPPDKPLLPSPKLRKGKFQSSAGTATGAPGSPEWEDMKKKVSTAVEEQHRKHNEYLRKRGLLESK